MPRDWGCNLCYWKLLLVEGEHTVTTIRYFSAMDHGLIGEVCRVFFFHPEAGSLEDWFWARHCYLSRSFDQVAFPRCRPCWQLPFWVDRGSVVLVGNVGSETVVWGEMFWTKRAWIHYP